MDDPNQDNQNQDQKTAEETQTTPPVSEVPANVEETSDETPIEVPNEPEEHPVETMVAKESLPQESPSAKATEDQGEFEAEQEAEEQTEAAVESPEDPGKPDEVVAEAANEVPEEKTESPSAEAKEKEETQTETEEAEPEESPSAEEETKPAKAKDDKEETVAKTVSNPNAKWYIVHTYSGHENKVAKSLKQRVQSLGFEDRIFDIIVPTRNTIKVSQGKKESIKEKIFPGYVLVRMELTDESWLLVRTTQGVTAFIGAGNKPTPISEKEVEAIMKFMAAEEPLYKTSFTLGQAVTITDGPFNGFLGAISEIDEAHGKLKVLVSIFGRETPVELDFLQVKKI